MNMPGQQVKVAEIRMESSRKARSPVYFIYGGILLFVVVLFLYKRLRSRNFFLKVLFNKKRMLNLHPD